MSHQKCNLQIARVLVGTQSIEQINTRLGLLDSRLARLETLEQQLCGCDQLERRIVTIEENIKNNSCQGVENSVAASNMETIASQLNNMAARVTLIENKLTLLQSSKVLKSVLSFFAVFVVTCD